MIVVMLIIIQMFMNIFIVGHSVSCTVPARTSGHDDHFLNEVLQCQKQLTLPGIHVKLIVQHFITTIYRSYHAGVSYGTAYRS